LSATPAIQEAQDPRALVIVGAGLAGWTTVREFRKLDTRTPIVLVTADSGDFYAKPTLANACAQKRSAEQLVTTVGAKMADTLNVTLHSTSHVRGIDTGAKTLSFSTADGATHTQARQGGTQLLARSFGQQGGQGALCGVHDMHRVPA